MAIKITHHFPHAPNEVWKIVGQPDRVDWVPGAESCEMVGNVRRFKLAGAGTIAEEIVELDHDTNSITYCVIDSEPALKSHKACIKLAPQDDGTLFTWTTEVDPNSVEPFIEKSMHASLAQIESILTNT